MSKRYIKKQILETCLILHSCQFEYKVRSTSKSEIFTSLIHVWHCGEIEGNNITFAISIARPKLNRICGVGYQSVDSSLTLQTNILQIKIIFRKKEKKNLLQYYVTWNLNWRSERFSLSYTNTKNM